MGEKALLGNSGNIGSHPVISVRASPANIHLSLSSKSATNVSIAFTLRGSSRPVTFFAYDTLLSPSTRGHSLIHRTFCFDDTISGAAYEPPIIEYMRIIDYNNFLISYANTENFLTLYPDTPYVVDRGLWPRADDGNSRADPHNMEPGRSYRMSLSESERRNHLWWRWGPKWQILRWRWWPFGEVKDTDDFVNGHNGWAELPQVEFVWEGDCVVHVTE